MQVVCVKLYFTYIILNLLLSLSLVKKKEKKITTNNNLPVVFQYPSNFHKKFNQSKNLKEKERERKA